MHMIYNMAHDILYTTYNNAHDTQHSTQYQIIDKKLDILHAQTQAKTYKIRGTLHKKTRIATINKTRTSTTKQKLTRNPNRRKS